MSPAPFRPTSDKLLGVMLGVEWLHFEYAWDSSSGKLSDLTGSGCTVYENVSYPGGNPFLWPSPPYATGSRTPNPTILPSPPVPGADGSLQDTHSPKPFLKPYRPATFSATQYYQYSCTCGNANNIDLAGPITVTRTVTQNLEFDMEIYNNEVWCLG